jgi:DNA-nicking Smr family endonuclease
LKTTHRPFRALAKQRPPRAALRAQERLPVAPPKLSFGDAVEASGVRPLPPGKRRAPKTAAPRAPSPREAPSFTVTPDPEWVEGYRSELGPRVLARLRGAPAATLDLHGMRAAAARVKLAAFLAAERGLARRVVLVIVGKGRHSPDGRAVLRSEVAAWLTASAHVLAFQTAPPRFGGGGCVLVALAGPPR